MCPAAAKKGSAQPLSVRRFLEDADGKSQAIEACSAWPAPMDKPFLVAIINVDEWVALAHDQIWQTPRAESEVNRDIMRP
jgi:hypothetical protein